MCRIKKNSVVCLKLHPRSAACSVYRRLLEKHAQFRGIPAALQGRQSPTTNDEVSSIIPHFQRHLLVVRQECHQQVQPKTKYKFLGLNEFIYKNKCIRTTSAAQRIPDQSSLGSSRSINVGLNSASTTSCLAICKYIIFYISRGKMLSNCCELLFKI